MYLFKSNYKLLFIFSQSHVRSETPYALTSVRQKQLTDAVAKHLVRGMKPVYTVEEQSFKDMLQVFDPRYTLPSRKTFSSVLLPKLYNKVKEDIVFPALNEAKYISITTDMWTSRSSDQYIGVTAHFISPDWKMARYTIENAELPPPHDNTHIAESLDLILDQWLIPITKISAIV